ncbi:helix-turn-helix domain-containing protein [Clostridium senegalense]|nr:helix-turn-helix domain-containing protein [Clostridium senegalense]
MSGNFIRKYTEEERVKIVEEALACGSNSLVAAKYNIHSGLVSNWKCNYRRYKQTLKPKNATQPKDEEIIVDYKKEYKKTKEKCKDLELEVAILHDLLKKKK